MISFLQSGCHPLFTRIAERQLRLSRVIKLSMTVRMPTTALDLGTALRGFAVLATIAAHRLRGAFTGRVERTSLSSLITP
jgi:hypothetical protein